MDATEQPVMTDTKLKRIAYLSGRDRDAQFNCLMHHFTKESLLDCFLRLNGKKAVGTDADATHIGEYLRTAISGLFLWVQARERLS
jgi:hypothetical protein